MDNNQGASHVLQRLGTRIAELEIDKAMLQETLSATITERNTHKKQADELLAKNAVLEAKLNGGEMNGATQSTDAEADSESAQE